MAGIPIGGGDVGVVPTVSSFQAVTVADFHEYQNYLTTQQAATEPVKQEPTSSNNTQVAEDEKFALELLPYEDLDRSQTFASAGAAVQLVFGKARDGYGGVWISPPLVDSSSDDFSQSFVYLISQGHCSFGVSLRKYYLGSENVKDLKDAGIFADPTFVVRHSSDEAVCPLTVVNCTHNRFDVCLELAAEVDAYTIYRTVGEYADEVRIRLRAIYAKGEEGSGLLTTYDVQIDYVDNDTGVVTTNIGSITTNDDGSSTAQFIHTPGVGVYSYVLKVTAENTAGIQPDAILIEIRQYNDNPESNASRISQYVNTTFLEATGNLYDLTREFSQPTGLKQLHTHIDNGVKVTVIRWLDPNDFSLGVSITYDQPSDIFGDLLYYYFETSTRYPQYVSALRIMDGRDIAFTALFYEANDLYFNGIIGSTTNFLSFAQETAPFFLSIFYRASDIYRLKPVIPVTNAGAINTAALTLKYTFTDTETGTDSINNTMVAGSYVRTYFDPSRRLPIQLNINWRNSRETGISFVTTTNIRYNDYPTDATVESYDLSAFCAREEHAILFGKHLLAVRRYSTHQIAFQTFATFDWDNFECPEVMDLIQVSINVETSYGDVTTYTNYYLVDSVITEPNNVVTITATHHPLDEVGGFSIINNEIVNGVFAVI